MHNNNALAERITDKFRLRPSPSLVVTPFHGAPVTFLRLRSDTSAIGLTGKIPAEDTFMFGLHLGEAPKAQMWLGTRPIKLDAVGPGFVSMLNLMVEPSALIVVPNDVLTFYVPRTVFDEFSIDSELTKIDELRLSPERAVQDPVLMHLGACLNSIIQQPDSSSKLFLDYITLAVLSHLAHAYSNMRGWPKRAEGRLALWQERTAMDFMQSNLSHDISLSQVARECGLSRSHFSRSFKQTTGKSPHQWIFERRIEKSKELLLNSQHPLSDVAVTCGFFDQSHFTRAFSKYVGVSPGEWRRLLRSTKSGKEK